MMRGFICLRKNVFYVLVKLGAEPVRLKSKFIRSLKNVVSYIVLICVSRFFRTKSSMCSSSIIRYQSATNVY